MRRAACRSGGHRHVQGRRPPCCDEPATGLTVVLASSPGRDDALGPGVCRVRAANLRMWPTWSGGPPRPTPGPRGPGWPHSLAVRVRGRSPTSRSTGTLQRSGILAGPVAARHHGRGSSAIGSKGSPMTPSRCGQLRPAGRGAGAEGGAQPGQDGPQGPQRSRKQPSVAEPRAAREPKSLPHAAVPVPAARGPPRVYEAHGSSQCR